MGKVGLLCLILSLRGSMVTELTGGAGSWGQALPGLAIAHAFPSSLTSVPEQNSCGQVENQEHCWPSRRENQASPVSQELRDHDLSKQQEAEPP